jgi:hypothetical protein
MQRCSYFVRGRSMGRGRGFASVDMGKKGESPRAGALGLSNGVGSSPRSLSRWLNFRRACSRTAVNSPTLFPTASGSDGLAAGPASGFPSLACGVRPLSPVRALPAGRATPDSGVTRCRGVNPFASPPFTARTATAGGSALASRYGSDLLTRKLPWPRHQATPVWTPPEYRKGSARFARRVPSTRAPLLCAPPLRRWPSGEVVSPVQRARAGSP